VTASASIPEPVQRFILTRFPSVPHLEAALLFHDQPSTHRTIQDVARALYLPEGKALSVVQGLEGSGLLARDGSHYRYAPSPGLVEIVDQVAQQYRFNLIGVTQLIHDSGRRSAQNFADAFKLRKD
jgi:hypothetical protein